MSPAGLPCSGLSPQLVGQRMRDLGAGADRTGEDSVFVVDLDRGIRSDRGSLVVSHEAEFGLGRSGSARVTIQPWSLTDCRPRTSP